MEAVELEAKEVLKKLFPKVSVPSNLVRFICYFFQSMAFLSPFKEVANKLHLHFAFGFSSASIPYSLPFLT